MFGLVLGLSHFGGAVRMLLGPAGERGEAFLPVVNVREHHRFSSVRCGVPAGVPLCCRPDASRIAASVSVSKWYSTSV